MSKKEFESYGDYFHENKNIKFKTMKNIHILQTDKPSRLFRFEDTLIKNDLIGLYDFKEKGYEAHHIYITSEDEIKEGDFKIVKYYGQNPQIVKSNYSNSVNNLYTLEYQKKIILTDNKDLIKDGIQTIPDNFLEWFVKNPSCERVGIEKEYNEERIVKGKDIGDYDYKIIIPKEEPYTTTQQKSLELAKKFIESKTSGALNFIMDEFNNKQETLEEAGLKHCYMLDKFPALVNPLFSFKEGAKLQTEQDKNKYSEEEAFNLCRDFAIFAQQKRPSYKKQLEWFEQFKKK
jgi:hypothetical protein